MTGGQRGLARPRLIVQPNRQRGCGRRVIGGQSGDGDEPSDPAAGVRQIEQRERHIDRVAFEDRRGAHAGVDVRGHGRRGLRQVPQRGEPPLAVDAARRFRDDGEQTAHAAAFVANRAVREREPAVFRIAVPLERQVPVVDRKRLAAANALEFRSDDGPDFRKNVAARLPERRMFRAQDRSIPVVVEETEIRSPRDHHGEPGLEHDADRGSKALRPGFDRAERRPAPVRPAHEGAHVSAAGKKVVGSRFTRSLACGHVQISYAPADGLAMIHYNASARPGRGFVP